MLTVALAVVLAALFRLRGSETWAEWTGRGATSARLFWAAAGAAAAYLVGPAVDAPAALFLAVSLWLGCVPAWWGSLGVKTWQEVALHSARGVVWVIPAVNTILPLHLGVVWPLLAAGVACGPVYLGCRLAWPGYAVPAAEWAWGLALGLALLLAVQMPALW